MTSISRAIFVGFGLFSVEFRWLTRRAYEVRGWDRRWGIFTGTYEALDRFFVCGPLMITFLATPGITKPYVRVF